MFSGEAVRMSDVTSRSYFYSLCLYSQLYFGSDINKTLSNMLITKNKINLDLFAHYFKSITFACVIRIFGKIVHCKLDTSPVNTTIISTETSVSCSTVCYVLATTSQIVTAYYKMRYSSVELLKRFVCLLSCGYYWWDGREVSAVR
jgi:hypothetical protein